MIALYPASTQTAYRRLTGAGGRAQTDLAQVFLHADEAGRAQHGRPGARPREHLVVGLVLVLVRVRVPRPQVGEPVLVLARDAVLSERARLGGLQGSHTTQRHMGAHNGDEIVGFVYA